MSTRGTAGRSTDKQASKPPARQPSGPSPKALAQDAWAAGAYDKALASGAPPLDVQDVITLQQSAAREKEA